MSQKILIALTLFALVVVGTIFFLRLEKEEIPVPDPKENEEESEEPQKEEPNTQGESEDPITVIADNLEIPWDIGFLPNGDYLISERSGNVVRITKNGVRTNIAISDVRHSGEGGLLGLVLHPNFSQNSWVYLYVTRETERGTRNSVERYTLSGNTLTNQQVLIDDIPGALFHNGGRLEFGPDGLLYITTGDATDPKLSQDVDSLAGKILRITGAGSIPEGNPFGTRVYSYGHRNPQGLAWDSEQNLWSTEHGRSGVLSGLDELNVIKPGQNYGWPDSQGDTVLPGTIGPVLHSGSFETWAPASAAYVNGSIFFGGLRGQTLYEAKIVDESEVTLFSHFHKEYGRIRTVRLGPDGFLYMMTSNQDGRGIPKSGDDRVLRIDPKIFN